MFRRNWQTLSRWKAEHLAYCISGDYWELVSGDLALDQHISILASSGETPGHQIVRIQTQDQTLYCTGDLYHHWTEIEQPTWTVRWANPTTSMLSRQKLAERALAENALLIHSHIPACGRLQQTSEGVRWLACEGNIKKGQIFSANDMENC